MSLLQFYCLVELPLCSLPPTLPGNCASALPATQKPSTLSMCRTTVPKSSDILTGGVLVRINRATDQLQPELAESWKLSDGGRAITFHLRAGLKFSDGSPLTASDVARTLNTALDPKEASPAGDTFRSSAGHPAVRVASPLEITIRYPEPKPGLDRLFDALSIVPAKAGKLPASAGPFFVSEYRPGDYVRLTRNPNYWKRDAAGKSLPYLDSIRIDIQPNREIELTRFLRGETHLINKIDAGRLRSRCKGEATRPPGIWEPRSIPNSSGSISLRRLPFRIGRKSGSRPPSSGTRSVLRYIATISRASSSAVMRIRPPDHSLRRIVSGSTPRSSRSPSIRTSALRGLVAEGFALRDGILRDRDGHAVEFSLITNAGNRPREAMAAVIQDDLRKIGIQVNIVTLDFSSLIERITKTLQYEACLLGFTNVEIDPMEQMNVWLSSGAQHAWWPLQKTPATPWEARIDKLELLQASEPARASAQKGFRRSAAHRDRTGADHLPGKSGLPRCDLAFPAWGAAGDGAAAITVEYRVSKA